MAKWLAENARPEMIYYVSSEKLNFTYSVLLPHPWLPTIWTSATDCTKDEAGSVGESLECQCSFSVELTDIQLSICQTSQHF